MVTRFSGRFGLDNHYENSNVETQINHWFMGEAPQQADNLPADANLRRFTVKNTAVASLGISTAGIEGKNDSFSKPVAGA